MSEDMHEEFVLSKEFQPSLMKMINNVLIIGEGLDDMNKSQK